MVKLLLLAVLALLVSVVTAQGNCGPPQCYSPCTNTKPIVDIVFMIDVSGSMATPISGVVSGLTTFVNNLSQNISPTFSLISFGAAGNGGKAVLNLNTVTSPSTLINGMNALASQSQSTGGSVEPGLETILESTGAAPASSTNFNIHFNTGYNNKKVFILVTNEDSDPARNNGNLFGSNGKSQNANYLDNKCKNDGTISASDWTNAWQLEVNAAANALISNDANVYMFVAGSASIGVDVSVGQTCNTHYQYCNPDGQIQSSDYSNFNAASTMSKMVTNGETGCLQYQLLNAGKIMRCFDVKSAANNALITNFFSQIVADLGKCHTECYDYICSSPTTCLPPVNMCGCDGVKNSGKVSDGHGGCCLPSAMDCAGYCAGTHSYDACGTCIVTGSSNSYCKTDCNGNHYLSSPPPGLTYISNIDAAGYLLMNADVKAAYINTWKTVQAIQDHYHNNGMFESRSYCTFDLADYNSRYGTSFTQAAAEANWLASLLTASPRTANCAAGSHRRFPPLPTDNCGQCIINADAPPYCVKDCTNTWKTSAANTYFTDNCGYCVAPGTNPNAHKDSCGVCDGTDAAKNQCGVCFGTTALDACSHPVCQNITCTLECDGVSRTTPLKHLDECGNCVLISAVRAATCIKDCAGVYYNNGTVTPPHHLDECGNCIPAAQTRLPNCTKDCSGTWGGTATYDACGQCVVNGVPPHVCYQDCAGVYYTSVQTPPHTIDTCGICNTPANQNNQFDNCKICKNKAGYNTTTDCTPDCKGVYSLTTSTGRAFTDICGDCWFANQTDKANSNMDSCGVCHSPLGPADPNWNAGSGTIDSNGFPCRCGQTPSPCSDGSTTCNDQCPVYCPETNNTKPDACGLCPGNPYYNRTDSCGVCCDPTAVPNLCDSEIDSCGVCFGFDAWKKNPCHICDPWYSHGNGTCKVDCKGVAGGHAKIGCDGICGSNAVCAVCGNGKLEGAETCDLGSDAHGKNLNVAGSGCNNCQAETGQLGAAIGGAIGGVAAIVALGVAAFFALRYAQKNGLIGSANKQVDFGASNSNPLYKSEVSVHQNPLYETS